jgi:hypothetical protein
MDHKKERPRTFASVVVRVFAPRFAMFGAVVATLVLGQMLGMSSALSSSSTPAKEPAHPMPSWTVAETAAYPGCVPLSAWPKGATADFVVVHRFRDGVRTKVRFATAWAANHNGTEVDDLWVLGVCGSRP